MNTKETSQLLKKKKLKEWLSTFVLFFFLCLVFVIIEKAIFKKTYGIAAVIGVWIGFIVLKRKKKNKEQIVE